MSPQFTDRQAKAWPEAIAEAQRYMGETIPSDIYYWTVQWDKEIRSLRGHVFNGVWLGESYLVEVRMDVYGYPTVSVAKLDWVHSSAFEDCECEFCERERMEEAGAS